MEPFAPLRPAQLSFMCRGLFFRLSERWRSGPSSFLPVRLDLLDRPALAAQADAGADGLAEELLGELGLVGDHVLFGLALPGSEDGERPPAAVALELDRVPMRTSEVSMPAGRSGARGSGRRSRRRRGRSGTRAAAAPTCTRSSPAGRPWRAPLRSPCGWPGSRLGRSAAARGAWRRSTRPWRRAAPARCPCAAPGSGAGWRS